MGLVSIIKQAYKICKRNRIIVNGKIVNNEYIMQPYDLVTFDVRKMLI
jgi:23S rRNA-/tRNA-specific pseudouridylate synthase